MVEIPPYWTARQASDLIGIDRQSSDNPAHANGDWLRCSNSSSVRNSHGVCVRGLARVVAFGEQFGDQNSFGEFLGQTRIPPIPCVVPRTGSRRSGRPSIGKHSCRVCKLKALHLWTIEVGWGTGPLEGFGPALC